VALPTKLVFRSEEKGPSIRHVDLVARSALALGHGIVDRGPLRLELLLERVAIPTPICDLADLDARVVAFSVAG
jgi:hypothetical protein